MRWRDSANVVGLGVVGTKPTKILIRTMAHTWDGCVLISSLFVVETLGEAKA